MAGDAGHTLMTKAVFECLPERERNIIRSEEDNILNIYCHDDFHHTKKGKKCLILPDGTKALQPFEIRKLYCPEAGAGKDFFICDYYTYITNVCDYYIKKIAETLKSGNLNKCAMFIGVFSHIIEDCSCPPHAIGCQWGVDLELIKLLLPPPDKSYRLHQFHSILENKYEDFSIKKYKPEILGETPSEAAFNMLPIFANMLENSIAHIIPMVKAYYNNNENLLEHHLALTAEPAIKILADALHTAFHIAADEKNGSQAPSCVDITTLPPYKWWAYSSAPYYCPVIRNSNMSLDTDFKPVPLELKINTRTVTIKRGIGTGTPFFIDYLIPVGIYKTFKSTIGLHSRLGKKGKIVFQVEVDGKKVFSSKITNIESTQEITIPLGETSRLSLITLPYENGGRKDYSWDHVTLPCENGGRKDYSWNHAIWAYPELQK